MKNVIAASCAGLLRGRNHRRHRGTTIPAAPRGERSSWRLRGWREAGSCVWILSATSSSVKLHIMQILCLLLVWQYRGMKAGGDWGLRHSTKRDGGGGREHSAKRSVAQTSPPLSCAFSTCELAHGYQSILFWESCRFFFHPDFFLPSPVRLHERIQPRGEVCRVLENTNRLVIG